MNSPFSCNTCNMLHDSTIKENASTTPRNICKIVNVYCSDNKIDLDLLTTESSKMINKNSAVLAV